MWTPTGGALSITFEVNSGTPWGTIESYTSAIPVTAETTTVTMNANNSVTVNDTTTGTIVTVTPKANDPSAQYTYSFDSWSGIPDAPILESKTITANFAQTINKYDVTISSNNKDFGKLKLNDGAAAESVTIEGIKYGST